MTHPLRPRWRDDPTHDALALPRDEYELVLADYAQRVAGAWAAALRCGDTAGAGRCVAQLRALAAAGAASSAPAFALAEEPSALLEADAGGARLFTGTAPSLWHGLQEVGARARQVDIVVAYAQPRGVELLAPWLDAVAREAPVRVLVGTYLNGTSVEALRHLLALAQRRERLAVRLLLDPSVHFHPKLYRVIDEAHRTHLFVGSSNLSYSALRGDARSGSVVEWNVALDDRVAPALVQAAVARLDDLFATVGAPLSEALIDAYEAQRPHALPPASLLEADAPPAPPVARPAQREALAALERLRAQGDRRALVVAATGLGKTVLAALDALRAAPDERVLFLAHREALLTQARDAFAQLRPGESCGVVCSTARELDARHLFVSIASAHYVDVARFRYVVVDEAHHGAAASYRRVFERLHPEAFVLGLTATPDRLDGGDIYALFDNVVAYEVGLLEAIERRWLVPFRYFGLRDAADYSHRALRSLSPRELEESVLAEERMARVVAALRDPAYAGERTLAFCVSIRHAQQVAARLCEAGVAAAAVHSGPSSLEPDTALARLRSGALAVLCVVDLFNEGVDVPELDRVALLRPTDSPVVFLQQLGRGLRLAPGKNALVVVDFVANHRRAELRAEWLGVAPEVVARTRAGEPFRRQFDDGRAVFFEPAAVDVLRSLAAAKPSLRERLRECFDALRAEAPDAPRPTYRALLARSGLAHGTVRSLFGSWSELLADRGAHTPSDARLARSPAARALLEQVEVTSMTGPHKMLLLGALAEARRSSATLDEAARLVRAFIERRHPAVLTSPRLDRSKLAPPAALAALLRRMPIKHLVEAAPACFAFEPATKTFRVRLPDDAPRDEVLAALEELAEARLFEFLRRRPSDDAGAR